MMVDEDMVRVILLDTALDIEVGRGILIIMVEGTILVITVTPIEIVMMIVMMIEITIIIKNHLRAKNTQAMMKNTS